MHENKCRFGSVVVDFAYFNLAFFKGFQYAVDDGSGGASVRDFRYGQCAVVHFLDFRPYFGHTSASSVVVTRHVYEAAGGEIREKLERFVPQISNGGVEYFVEIMRQYFRREPDCDAFRSLSQQQRKLSRQRDGLFLASVVAQSPFRHFGIVKHIEGECRQASFDVSSGCSRGAGKDIAPVSLRFHKQFFLSELHECVVYGLVAVRVILHGVSHYVGHFVESPVVEGLHGVEDAALHGF